MADVRQPLPPACKRACVQFCPARYIDLNDAGERLSNDL